MKESQPRALHDQRLWSREFNVGRLPSELRLFDDKDGYKNSDGEKKPASKRSKTQRGKQVQLIDGGKLHDITEGVEAVRDR